MCGFKTVSVAAYRAAVEEIGDINAVVLGRDGGKGKSKAAKAKPDDRPGLFDGAQKVSTEP